MNTLATRSLPRTGHALTALGLGGAPRGNLYDVISEAHARATVDAAWAAGIRCFDTAPLRRAWCRRAKRAGGNRCRSRWCTTTRPARSAARSKTACSAWAPITSTWRWVQFPLAHPAVVSVVPGARNAAELQGIVQWMRHPIPPALWLALREQGLVHADAPVPGG